jgi:hypothetical protein
MSVKGRIMQDLRWFYCSFAKLAGNFVLILCIKVRSAVSKKAPSGPMAVQKAEIDLSQRDPFFVSGELTDQVTAMVCYK